MRAITPRATKHTTCDTTCDNVGSTPQTPVSSPLRTPRSCGQASAHIKVNPQRPRFYDSHELAELDAQGLRARAHVCESKRVRASARVHVCARDSKCAGHSHMHTCGEYECMRLCVWRVCMHTVVRVGQQASSVLEFVRMRLLSMLARGEQGRGQMMAPQTRQRS